MADVKKAARIHGKRYLCGVPDSRCFGVLSRTHQQGRKVHSSTEEAFKCMERFLISEGYTKVGPREFAAPNDGPIRVLTKKSRYGGVMRCGKEGRWMFPKDGTGAGITSQ